MPSQPAPHPAPLAYAVDTTRWPLVVIHATEAVRDDVALERSYDCMAAMLGRRERYACLVDLRGAYSTAARRKRLVRWLREHEPTIRELCAGCAVVAGSALERGLVTAVQWLVQPYVPLRVFGSTREAQDWLRDVLAC